MLEIVAIIFIVLTIPLWLPLVAGIVTSLLSFGFMAIFWLIFIAAVLYLILALGGINNSYCSSGSGQ